MGLASFFQWLPANAQESSQSTSSITDAQWRVLAEARQKRTSLILYPTAERSGNGHQSLILNLAPKQQCCAIDLPFPALSAAQSALPQRVYGIIKYPGTYRHWLIDGAIVAKSSAKDGPFYQFRIDRMEYCADRRRQARFHFVDKEAEIICSPPMETAIYGSVENISLGGLCFSARGNLQQSDAFYMASQGRKSSIPVNIALSAEDKLSVELEVLVVQVFKRPYLHSRVRAKFKALTTAQQHLLAALTEQCADAI